MPSARLRGSGGDSVVDVVVVDVVVVDVVVVDVVVVVVSAAVVDVGSGTSATVVPGGVVEVVDTTVAPGGVVEVDGPPQALAASAATSRLPRQRMGAP
jgi:hypothetical protein